MNLLLWKKAARTPAPADDADTLRESMETLEKRKQDLLQQIASKKAEARNKVAKKDKKGQTHSKWSEAE